MTQKRTWTHEVDQISHSPLRHSPPQCDRGLPGLIAAVNGSRIERGGLLRGRITMRSLRVGDVPTRRRANVPVGGNAEKSGARCFLAKSTLCLLLFRHDLKEGRGRVMGNNE